MELTETQNQQQEAPSELLAFRGEIYRGPLPDPEMLESYKKADSSFPERIMKMAEKHNSADVGIKKSFIFSNTIIPLAGQFFTFLLCAGGLYVCIYLAQKGFTGEAITAVIVGFSPIIINALKSFKQNGHSKQNSNSQQEKHN